MVNTVYPYSTPILPLSMVHTVHPYKLNVKLQLLPGRQGPDLRISSHLKAHI
jgi:hypothetical protein